MGQTYLGKQSCGMSLYSTLELMNKANILARDPQACKNNDSRLWTRLRESRSYWLMS